MLIEAIIEKSQLFLLIIIRLLGMIWVAPFFSSFLIPMRVKVIFAFMVSIIIYPILEQIEFRIPDDLIGYIALVVNEVVVGISIGMMMSIIMTCFQLMGQFFSVQMGFGISEVLDPISQSQVPIVGQFLALLGILIFLGVDGDIFLIRVLVESYTKVPVLDIMESSGPLLDKMVGLFSSMFIIALKLSLPIIGVLLIVTFSLGLLARFAPQMNILMLGFPIYIMIGLFSLILLIPEIVRNGRYYLLNRLSDLFGMF